MAFLKVIDEDQPQTLSLSEDDRGRLQYLCRDGVGLGLAEQRPASFLAALMRADPYWLVMADPGNAVTVNKVPVLGLKVLGEGDVLEASGFRLRMVAMRRERLSADAPLITQRRACPVCMKQFSEGDEVLYCPNCDLAHHEECIRFNRRCAGPYCPFVLPVDDEGSEERSD